MVSFTSVLNGHCHFAHHPNWTEPRSLPPATATRLFHHRLKFGAPHRPRWSHSISVFSTQRWCVTPCPRLFNKSFSLSSALQFLSKLQDHINQLAPSSDMLQWIALTHKVSHLAFSVTRAFKEKSLPPHLSCICHLFSRFSCYLLYFALIVIHIFIFLIFFLLFFCNHIIMLFQRTPFNKCNSLKSPSFSLHIYPPFPVSFLSSVHPSLH